MRPTRFETRHPTLLHLLIVGAAWATYLVDRDDVVWRIIRDSPSPRVLEHAVFSVATLLIGAGALLCTRSRTSSVLHTRHRLIGEWLYAFGLATLLPLWGSVLLVLGESVRLARLALNPEPLPQQGIQQWPAALRHESVKWCIVATMIIFSVSLVDRVADYGILASLLTWALLSATPFWECARL